MLTRTLHQFIAGQVPEYLRTQNPAFVAFLEEYYKFLEVEGPNDFLLALDDYLDVDTTVDAFVAKMRSARAWDIPTSSVVDAKRIIRFIGEYYDGKGSEQSAELFFRLMYNAMVRVTYPGQQVLRASDGNWVQKRTIKVVSQQNDDGTYMDVFALRGRVLKLRYMDYLPSIGAVAGEVTTQCFDVVRTSVSDVFELTVDLDPKTEFYSPDSLVNLQEYFGQSYTIGDEAADKYTETTGLYIDTPETHINVVLDDVIYGTLTRQVVDYQILSPGVLFKPGDLFFFDEQGPFGDYYLSDYTADNSYASNDVDNRAMVRVAQTKSSIGAAYQDDDTAYYAEEYTVPSNEGELVSLHVLSTGYKFFGNDFTSPLVSGRQGGSTAQVKFITGFVNAHPYRFEGSGSFLSDTSRLQDNFKYQPFSYMIETEVPEYVWGAPYRQSAHPAGMRVLGTYVIKGEVETTYAYDIDSRLIVRELPPVSLADTLALADQIALNPNVMVTDAFEMHDQYMLDTTKGLSEVTAIGERVASDLSVSFNDAATVGDDVALNTNLAATDTIVALDIANAVLVDDVQSLDPFMFTIE